MNSKKTISPIIIVGAGRSGSTLLDRVLDAHPDISMFGETRFFAHKLFTLIDEASKDSWNNAQTRPILAYVSQLKNGNASGNEKTLAEFQAEESNRVTELVRHSFEYLYYLDLLPGKFWGLKEIWNGNRQPLDWNVYHRIFPNATWVHILRNPYVYARSVSGWMHRDFTDNELTSQLRTWKAIYDTSIKLRGTSNYFEIKYEDLTTSPQQTLTPLLTHLGLEWSEDCQVPLKQKWVSTKELPIYPKGYEALAKKCEVDVIMDAYDYAIPSQVKATRKAPSKANKSDLYRLVIGPAFNKGVGDSNYWLYNLTTYPSAQESLNLMFKGKPLSQCDFDLFENSRKLKRLPYIEDLLKSNGGEFFVFDVAIAFTPFDCVNPNSTNINYELVLSESYLAVASSAKQLRTIWGRFKDKVKKV